MIRIFVAFPLRNKLAKSFLELSEKNSAVKYVRWTPEENLHITLFFIGEVDEKHLDEIKSILDTIFKEQASFSLSFESIAFAGKKKKASMIWGRFKKNEAFTQLSEKIYKGVKQFMTIDQIHRDPVPHCTIARIKPSTDKSSIETSISAGTSCEILIDKAELWQTVQVGKGVKYDALHRMKNGL